VYKNCRCADKRRSYLADNAKCNNGSSSSVRMFQPGFVLAAISKYPCVLCAYEFSIFVMLLVQFPIFSAGSCFSVMLLLYDFHVNVTQKG